MWRKPHGLCGMRHFIRWRGSFRADRIAVARDGERSGGDGALESDTRQRTYGARRYPAGAGEYHPAAFVFGKTGDRADSEKRGCELADRSDEPVL